MVMFGSLRSVVLAFLPVVGGALASITVALLLFGQVHGLTLAIGSTLIGVAIDYPILLLTHRVLAPDESPDQALDRVWMGALMGGVTTAAGFIALTWTSFPGVREMAVASAVGHAGRAGRHPLRDAAAAAGRARDAPACWSAGPRSASARSTGCAATAASPSASSVLAGLACVARAAACCTGAIRSPTSTAPIRR